MICVLRLIPLSPNSSNSPFLGTLTPEPTLELKHLPNSLTFVFLSPDKTFPVIITFDLNEDQEGKLLKVLREHKDVIGGL